MGRQSRDVAPGIFHVFTHCVWAAPAHFRDDLDRTIFLRELARATARTEWTCIAFCLMKTHYHLILAVGEGVLPRGMQALNWRYSMEFNQRHRMRGHAQFGRYGSRRIESDGDLLSTFRYVALNPVEANLCRSPSEWAWSTYAGTVDLGAEQPFVDPTPLLACVGGPREIAAARLRTFVEKP